jgi:hypothetical protein
MGNYNRQFELRLKLSEGNFGYVIEVREISSNGFTPYLVT